MTRLGLLLLLIAATGIRLTAQQSVPAFEVASIRVSSSGLPGNVWGGGPGRFVVDGITAANLIRNAYDLRPEEMVGGPAWLDTERFQINATYPPESGTPQVNAMLRSLLQDRFALKAHRERRELAKYHLVLADAKGRLGPQLKKSSPQCPTSHPERPCMMRGGMGELVMQEATSASSWTISNPLPVGVLKIGVDSQGNTISRCRGVVAATMSSDLPSSLPFGSSCD